MKMKLLLVLASVLVAASAYAADAMKAFPPAEKGMARHVLALPREADESLLKVEIVVGKTVETDERNRYFFGGKIEAETIKGWGYTRYVVSEMGPMAGTKIAVPPDAPKVRRFVSLGGEPYLVRYNSKLPIVVYAPAEAEVRFRLWRGDAEAREMPKG